MFDKDVNAPLGTLEIPKDMSNFAVFSFHDVKVNVDSSRCSIKTAGFIVYVLLIKFIFSFLFS